MSKITPFLWFDGQAEEAMDFYVALFPDAKAGQVSRMGDGSVMTVSFELNGQAFVGLNGGPMYKFTEAVSFMIDCKDQAEVDHYWNGLLAGGGQESQCGWLKDRFGVSWQVIPQALPRLMSDPDREKAGRVVQAMLQMRKLDVAALEAAAAG